MLYFDVLKCFLSVTKILNWSLISSAIAHHYILSPTSIKNIDVADKQANQFIETDIRWYNFESNAHDISTLSESIEMSICLFLKLVTKIIA